MGSSKRWIWMNTKIKKKNSVIHHKSPYTCKQLPYNRPFTIVWSHWQFLHAFCCKHIPQWLNSGQVSKCRHDSDRLCQTGGGENGKEVEVRGSQRVQDIIVARAVQQEHSGGLVLRKVVVIAVCLMGPVHVLHPDPNLQGWGQGNDVNVVTLSSHWLHLLQQQWQSPIVTSTCTAPTSTLVTKSSVIIATACTALPATAVTVPQLSPPPPTLHDIHNLDQRLSCQLSTQQ